MFDALAYLDPKHSARSTEEAKTRALFDAYLYDNWSPASAGIAQVFKAMWTSALSASKITRIIEAMFEQGISEEDVQVALTSLVRAKVLRSRTPGGIRLYEVRY